VQAWRSIKWVLYDPLEAYSGMAAGKEKGEVDMSRMIRVLQAIYHRIMFGLRSELFKGKRLRSLRLLWEVEYYEKPKHNGHV
jgi:hypothetical protein